MGRMYHRAENRRDAAHEIINRQTDDARNRFRKKLKRTAHEPLPRNWDEYLSKLYVPN